MNNSSLCWKENSQQSFHKNLITQILFFQFNSISAENGNRNSFYPLIWNFNTFCFIHADGLWIYHELRWNQFTFLFTSLVIDWSFSHASQIKLGDRFDSSELWTDSMWTFAETNHRCHRVFCCAQLEFCRMELQTNCLRIHWLWTKFDQVKTANYSSNISKLIVKLWRLPKEKNIFAISNLLFIGNFEGENIFRGITKQFNKFFLDRLQLHNNILLLHHDARDYHLLLPSNRLWFLHAS